VLASFHARGTRTVSVWSRAHPDCSLLVHSGTEVGLGGVRHVLPGSAKGARLAAGEALAPVVATLTDWHAMRDAHTGRL